MSDTHGKAKKRDRLFVFQDTANLGYRYVRAGLLRRGWQQIRLPRRRAPEVASDCRWVQCRRLGAIGVASPGYKGISVPDLIWALSCGRVPEISDLGEEQATNFFDQSSCLTTKAGLCRTLQSTREWGSGSDHGDASLLPPSSIFPRCFDLSDPSQVDDFKENFRQTAAASVLKMYHRTNDKLRGLSDYQDNNRTTRSLAATTIPANLERSDFGGCFGGLHSWMLALSVRVCRRQLLNMSGWREDYVGPSSESASGVEPLTPQEWDSLLLYSYHIRRVSQPSPNTANPAGHCTSNGWNGSAVCADAGRQGTVQLGPEGLGLASNEEPQAACALCEPSGTPQQQRRPDREHDTQVARCYDGSASGVGLRGLQNLCGGTLCTSRATVALRIGSNGKPRRPSSAPTRRRPGRVGAEHRQASIWGRGWTLAAGEMPSRERRTATDRGICPATPRTRAEEEQMKLRDGLEDIWRSSGVSDRCPGCHCPGCLETARDASTTSMGPRTDGEERCKNIARLTAEATQLCIALEWRCPQWTIDGNSNVWVLKPAGASRGQGVRLAWTLDQVLHAQKTMGGRVVQKYVETPFLLLRRPATSVATPTPTPSRHAAKRKQSVVGYENDCYARSSRPCGYPGRVRGIRQRNTDGFRQTDGIDVDDTIDAQNTPCAPAPVELGASPTAAAGTPSPSHEQRETESRVGDQVPAKDVGGRGEPIASGGGATTAATKFDIRLWVLVTGWDPLEAFLYDECYLRVCPEPYTLAESSLGDPDVHLTNLSVRRSAGSTGAKVTAGSPSCRRRRPSSASPRGNSVNPGMSGACHDGHAAKRCRLVDRGLAGEGATVDSWERAPLEGDDNGVTCAEEENEKNYDRSDFVASQAELVQRLGEAGVTVAGPGPTMGGDQKSGSAEEAEETRARGERLWRDRVFPSIERVVRSTLLAARQHVLARASSFQLFGFDLLLDRELNPWLLEVNLSPALSHSSKHHSEVIRSMCEGVLRLTVDRIFPPPRHPSSADVKTSIYSDADYEATNTMDTGDAGQKNESKKGESHPRDNERSHPFGKWTRISFPTSSSCSSKPDREPHQDTARPSSTGESSSFSSPTSEGHVLTTADAVYRNAQVFSVRGRHLSRHGLARAERGVRETMAATLLAACWRARADGIREWRVRESRAIAVVRRWVVTLVARRRRAALRAIFEISARRVQVQWRRRYLRVSARRQMILKTDASVRVQAAWRLFKLNHRCRIRRIRYAVAVGMKRWASVLLRRRRNRAAHTISQAVAAETARRRRQRSAARVVARFFRATYRRRRQSRLRLQRFARMPCLLTARLAAQKCNRIARTQNEAGIIILGALRTAAARSGRARVVLAARTLQEWGRQVLRRRSLLRASAVAVQRIWRQRQRRSLYFAAVQLQRIAEVRRHHDFPSSVDEIKLPLRKKPAGVAIVGVSSHAAAKTGHYGCPMSVTTAASVTIERACDTIATNSVSQDKVLLIRENLGEDDDLVSVARLDQTRSSTHTLTDTNHRGGHQVDVTPLRKDWFHSPRSGPARSVDGGVTERVAAVVKENSVTDGIGERPPSPATTVHEDWTGAATDATECGDDDSSSSIVSGGRISSHDEKRTPVTAAHDDEPSQTPAISRGLRRRHRSSKSAARTEEITQTSSRQSATTTPAEVMASGRPIILDAERTTENACCAGGEGGIIVLTLDSILRERRRSSMHTRAKHRSKANHQQGRGSPDQPGVHRLQHRGTHGRNRRARGRNINNSQEGLVDRRTPPQFHLGGSGGDYYSRPPTTEAQSLKTRARARRSHAQVSRDSKPHTSLAAASLTRNMHTPEMPFSYGFASFETDTGRGRGGKGGGSFSGVGIGVPGVRFGGKPGVPRRSSAPYVGGGGSVLQMLAMMES